MAHTSTPDGASGAFDRRAFLRFAPLGAAGLGMFLLNACQPPPAGSSTTAPPAAAPGASAPKPAAAAGGYPVTVPDTFAPKPDLPSTGNWIDNAYVNYPANPAKWSTESPGRGGSMTYFNQAVYPPAAALDRNTSWQQVNKQLNIEVRANYTAPVDYPAKLAALMAGNDLPDMFALWQGLGTAQRLP